MGFWTWKRVGQTNKLLTEQLARELVKDGTYCPGSRKLAEPGGLCPVCHRTYRKKKRGGAIPLHLALTDDATGTAAS